MLPCATSATAHLSYDQSPGISVCALHIYCAIPLGDGIVSMVSSGSNIWGGLGLSGRSHNTTTNQSRTPQPAPLQNDPGSGARWQLPNSDRVSQTLFFLQPMIHWSWVSPIPTNIPNNIRLGTVPIQTKNSNLSPYASLWSQADSWS